MNVFAAMSQLVSMLKRLPRLQKATKATKAIKATKATKATEVHKSTEAHQVGVLSLALGPFLPAAPKKSCDVSSTIIIITYKDV